MSWRKYYVRFSGKSRFPGTHVLYPGASNTFLGVLCRFNEGVFYLTIAARTTFAAVFDHFVPALLWSHVGTCHWVSSIKIRPRKTLRRLERIFVWCVWRIVSSHAFICASLWKITSNKTVFFFAFFFLQEQVKGGFLTWALRTERASAALSFPVFPSILRTPSASGTFGENIKQNITFSSLFSAKLRAYPSESPWTRFLTSPLTDLWPSTGHRLNITSLSLLGWFACPICASLTEYELRPNVHVEFG